MKKRFALILCALVLCLGLSSCGGAKAEKEEKTLFGGRLGEYKYYDMDAVIDAALRFSEKTLG